MKLLYKKVLDQLLKTSYLDNNIYLQDGEVIEKLFEKCIFDLSEQEDINRYETNKEKVKCMIKMLIVKDDASYESLKQCLNTEHKHVVKEMLRMEIELQKSCEDCLQYIQNVLVTNYIAETSSSVGFEEIQNRIIAHVRKSSEHHGTLIGVLDDGLLMDCIKKSFPAAEKYEEVCTTQTKPTTGKKKKSPRTITTTRLTINGLTKKNVAQQTGINNSECVSSDSSDESDSYEQQLPDNPTTKHFNVDEFACLVEEILNEKDWDPTIPDKIKEHMVDSEVYELMSDEDKTLLFPRIGERIRIKAEWEKIKRGTSMLDLAQSKHKQQIQFERLRRFDHPASEGTKYTQGSKVRVMPRRPGNLLTPVHMYFMFGKTNKVNEDNVDNFLHEVIHFASACMNDRTNGTFHAGISLSNEIVGCNMDINTLDCRLTSAIKQNFKEYQVEVALKSIRPPQYIEVITRTAKTEILHVVEIDVVPHSRFVELQTFCVKDKKKGSYDFYRYQGELKKQGHSEIEEFMQREKMSLIEQRIEKEKSKLKRRKENLNKRLKDFLCCGEDTIEESLYPVLVLSHNKINDKDKLSDGEFFKDIPWRAVFDFNEKDEDHGFQCGLEQRHAKAFNTRTVDDFHSRKRDEKSIKQTRENITDSPLTTWIYCNGTDDNDTDTDARTWIHKTGESFRKAIEFYSEIIPATRGRIIIPIFQKNYFVLTEAIVEILMQFGKQCLILCPSRSIASVCYDELRHRPNAFPPGCAIDDCFLIGLPWDHVNECVSGILKSTKITQGIKIPRSNGVPHTIDEKVVSELSDLEIVGINECRDVEQLTAGEECMREQEFREEYHKGGEVKWQNFYFQDHVLARDVHRELCGHVRQALDENENEGLGVEKVAVYHQPGSGGSTTSRHILWDLRETYRCCVVNKITNQTCDQIGRFRKLGEKEDEDSDIRPILVLLDSNNEDAILQFVDDLENEREKHNCDLLCVLLICFRVSALPLDRPSRYVMLRQMLSSGEHNWFKEKYKTLLEKYQLKRGCDPHTLLGFNIMKENFNMDSIKHSVREFVNDPLISPKQMKLLKQLSFLNAYDLHFQSVPISCFDPIMAPHLQWINYFPPSLRVLTSRCRRQGCGGHNSAIRMSNYLLSKPVLDAILETEREQETYQNTIGEVALEVMDSDCFTKGLYKYENKLLRNILGDIMKKRDRCSSNNGKLDKFSPLITALLNQDDSDLAIRIVSVAYDITDDPLVAQHLARLNAELENWNGAHIAIDKAIVQKSHNSYLIHTKGQLFKDELQVAFSHKARDESPFPTCQVDGAVSLAYRAVDCYRQSQKLTENQNMSQQNPAGYESEILVVIELFKLLERCEELKPLSQIFKGSRVMPDLLSTSNYNFLKALPDIVNVTMEKLERIIHGTHRNLFHSHTRSLYTIDRKQLDKHREELVRHFYLENTNKNVSTTANNVHPDVWSFISAFRFPDFQHLLRSFNAMHRTNTDLRNHNLRIYLAMYISLSVKDSSSLLIEPDQMLSLSRKYYDTNRSGRSDLAVLESHLYFTALHWPLESRKYLEDKLSPFSAWSKAILSWLEIDNNRSSNQRRNDKIFFYLGNKGPFPRFVTIEGASSILQLATFTGVVDDNGTYINIITHSFQSDKGHSLRIPFYRRLGRALLYNRKLEVIIGFGLQGPRADWLDKPSSFRIARKSDTWNRKSNHVAVTKQSAPITATGQLPLPENQPSSLGNEMSRSHSTNDDANRWQPSQHSQYQNQIGSSKANSFEGFDTLASSNNSSTTLFNQTRQHEPVPVNNNKNQRRYPFMNPMQMGGSNYSPDRNQPRYDTHRNPKDLQYAQQSSNPLSASNSGYRNPQQRQNSAKHLQQSSRQPSSGSSMLRTPMFTMHQKERKYTWQFPRQTGVTRLPRQANVARFTGQVDVPRFPRQTGVTGFPRQANVARFTGQVDVPGFPRQMGVTRIPGQADDSLRNQHTQQIPPHVQYQPQTLQNIQNRAHTEDRFMFNPHLPQDY